MSPPTPRGSSAKDLAETLAGGDSSSCQSLSGPNCNSSQSTGHGAEERREVSRPTNEPKTFFTDLETEPEVEPRETLPHTILASSSRRKRRSCRSSSNVPSQCQGLQAFKQHVELHSSLPKTGLHVAQWFANLHSAYGIQLLLLLFASQHIQRGLVQQMRNSSVMWLFRDYGVNGPEMQVFHSVSNAAWALKPVIGVASDLFPIGGYNKAPYVVLTSVVGVVCAGAMGMGSQATMSLGVAVLCLFGMSLQASTCDLLTEAKYSEHINATPKYGPDLITFIWGGITIGGIFGLCLVGILLPAMGPRAVFLACVVPASCVLYPAMANYFGEVRLSPEAVSNVRQAFFRQGELLFLCILMTVLTLALTSIGTMPTSHKLHCTAAISVLFIIIPCFHLVMRPEIACVNTFFVLQSALSMTISGATFYFFTERLRWMQRVLISGCGAGDHEQDDTGCTVQDGAKQYPSGPHFSVGFFTTTLGLMSCFMSLLGLITYNKWMKNWSYRALLLLTNLLVTFLSLLDTLMFLRWNDSIGIPDTCFIMGSSVATAVIRQWRWMPGVVIMSQLCPKGMEATMFALLAGCDNIGNQISDYIGAYVLEVLAVHPRGADNEGNEFNNLWKASLVATLLPFVTIFLIPVCIPHSKQTDKLLMSHASSPTTGSPFSWLIGRDRYPSVHDVDVARDHF